MSCEPGTQPIELQTAPRCICDKITVTRDERGSCCVAPRRRTEISAPLQREARHVRGSRKHEVWCQRLDTPTR